MSINMKRALAAAAAAAVGVATALTVAAAPAEAVCRGSSGVTAVSYVNGNLVAVERAASGTCDADSIYDGYIRDPFPDGYAARIRYWDGWSDDVVAFASSNTPVAYRFYDQNGDSSAQYQLYANPAHRPTYWSNTYGY